ncbi:MAG: histidine ammonia-lyase, partial [Anaerolineales bacterium]
DAAGRDDESGWADLDGARMTGRAAMEAAGISRIVLGAKEGLALNNGATFSAALAALAVADGENLERNAEVALAMMLEALLGVSAAFHADLHAARRHAGQIAVAAAIRGLIAGSTFVDAGGRVQDPYSLRCAPQVLGPVRETLARVRAWTEAEINAATDNPLIFPDMDGPIKAISGGNFHGEVVGMAMDFLGVALAEVGALAERQVYRLLSDRHSFGLPPMLVDEAAAGLNSGLMMPHYTTASLVLENQTLAHPDTVHSLPTSAGQEDHNANALTAARHARQIVANVTHILAVEFFAVAQAVDLRARMLPEARLAPATAAARACIREAAPFIDGDRLFQADIRAVEELVRGGAIVRAVRAQDDVGLPAGE